MLPASIPNRSPWYHLLTRLLLGLALVGLFALHALHLQPLPLLASLDRIAYDLRMRLTMPGTQDRRIVIADIDEASLAQVGRWPWPRSHMARITRRLFDDYAVRAVGFDMVFAEPEASSALDLLEDLASNELKDQREFLDVLERLRPGLQHDRLFAEALQGRPVVLGYYFQSPGQEGAQSRRQGSLPASWGQSAALGYQPAPHLISQGYVSNIQILHDHSPLAGSLDSPLVSPDGVFRRMPLLRLYAGELYPSLALALAHVALGRPEVRFASVAAEFPEHLPWLALGDLHIPLDRDLATHVPFRGTQGSFPYVSLADVLDGHADAALLRGAIVLVGTTAPGLMDLRSTPVQPVYPGVEIHANMVSALLDGHLLRPLDDPLTLLLLLLVPGVVLTLWLPRLPPATSAGLTLLVLGLLFLADALFWKYGWVLPVDSFVLVGALFVLHMSYGFFVESHGRRQLARTFGQYIPRELVAELALSRRQARLGGESRVMSVLFSDVRGFTGISEGLAPEELSRLMNALLTPMTREIHAFRGTIDKYMGDAVMAFWGAPLPDPDHAVHAIEAGFALVRCVEGLHNAFRARGWPELHVGVGINSGSMNVGNMGSEFRMAYTVLGDAVNLGSRLEGLTRYYGVSLIVGPETRAAAGDRFVFRELDRAMVKGSRSALPLYEPYPQEVKEDSEFMKLLAEYETALELFRRREWRRAREIFLALSRAEPQRALHMLYLERINRFLRDPPGMEWDGVHEHTAK
ncbi:MAG: adenylate/guanylate cyclase domain-containing protein [Magnetococcus sp. WYHC-3]